MHLVVEADVTRRIRRRHEVEERRVAGGDLHAVERVGAGMSASVVGEDRETVADGPRPADVLARLRSAARERQVAGRIDHQPVVRVRGRRDAGNGLGRTAVEPELRPAVVLQDEQVLAATPLLPEERLVGRDSPGLETEIHDPDVCGRHAGADPLRAGRRDGRELLRHVDADGLHQEEAHRPSVAQRGRDFIRERSLVAGDVGDLLEGVPLRLVFAAVRRAMREEQLVVELVHASERERDRLVGLLRHAHRARSLRDHGKTG